VLNALGDESLPSFWAQAGEIGWCDLALKILVMHRSHLPTAIESCKAIQYLAAVIHSTE